MHKIKKLTGRSTTSLSLEEVLRSVNPVLRGWDAYFPAAHPRERSPTSGLSRN
ncbi:group II intron maturase-specific domain-containing protein [Streptomyces sp. NPDC001970]